MLTALNGVDHPLLTRVMSTLTVLGNTSSWCLAGIGSLSAPVGAVMMLFAMGVGCFRVYLGAHYPADVTAGALLGIPVGLTIAAFAPMSGQAIVTWMAHFTP